jgi:hypothetical protein
VAQKRGPTPIASVIQQAAARNGTAHADTGPAWLEADPAETKP